MVHDDLRLLVQVALDVLVAQAEITVGNIDGLFPVFIAVLQQRQLEILRPVISRLRITVADQLRALRAHGHRGVDLAPLVLVRDTFHIGHALQPRPLHEVIVLPVDVVDADHFVILVIPRHGDAAVVLRPGHAHPDTIYPDFLHLYQLDRPRLYGFLTAILNTEWFLVLQHPLRTLRHVLVAASGVSVSVLVDAAERLCTCRRRQRDTRTHQRIIVGQPVLIIIGVEIPQIFVIREMNTRVTQLVRVQPQIVDGLGGLAAQSHPGVIRLAAAGCQYVQLLHQRPARCLVLPRHLEDHIVAALAILHPAAERYRILAGARTASGTVFPALPLITALRLGQVLPADHSDIAIAVFKRPLRHQQDLAVFIADVPLTLHLAVQRDKVRQPLRRNGRHLLIGVVHRERAVLHRDVDVHHLSAGNIVVLIAPHHAEAVVVHVRHRHDGQQPVHPVHGGDACATAGPGRFAIPAELLAVHLGQAHDVLIAAVAV